MFKTCPVCKKEFKVQPNEYERRTYCSRECMGKAYNKRIEKECLVCGKKFKVPNNVHRKDAKFCSKTCSGKYFSGDKHWNFQHGRGKNYTLEQHQQWYQNHKLKSGNVVKINESNRRVKLKKRKVEGSHTVEEWNALLEKHEYRCFYCKELMTLEEGKRRITRDHVIPIEKGGTDFIENIVPACKSCNGKKGSKPAKEVFPDI